MRTSVAFAAIFAALLSGCATAPSTSAGLSGTRWTIVRIDGAAPVVPTKASMRFDEERMGASVGCNSIGGDYRVEHGRLVAGPLMATRMFCEGPVWQQEEAVNALLSAAPQVERRGDALQLTSGGHTLHLQLTQR